MGFDGIVVGLLVQVFGYCQVNCQNVWDVLGFDGMLWDVKLLFLQ